jgi:hypothetical protein
MEVAGWVATLTTLWLLDRTLITDCFVIAKVFSQFLFGVMK